MNEVVIELDEKTKFWVYFDKQTNLYFISGEQGQFRFTIDGFERKELEQLQKAIKKILEVV